MHRDAFTVRPWPHSPESQRRHQPTTSTREGRKLVAGLIAAGLLVAGLVGDERFCRKGSRPTWDFSAGPGQPATFVEPSRPDVWKLTLAGVRGDDRLPLPPVQRITYHFGASLTGARCVPTCPIWTWSARGGRSRV